MPTTGRPGSELILASLAGGAVTLLGCALASKFLAARRSKPVQEASRIYEEKALLDQYMLFNFAEPRDFLLFEDLGQFSDVTNCICFPKRIALLCKDYCPDIFFANEESSRGPRRALDVGCAVGRSCFELSKLFDDVIGIDYSASFVRACDLMREHKSARYESTLEGDLNQELIAQLDADVRVDRVRFEQGDACNLRADLGQFDLVLASNLVCRLVEPQKFLDRVKQLVKPGKYAIFSTPFTWGRQYTPQENWIGGYKDATSQRAVHGDEGLKRALDDSFHLRHELNIPMMIRETRRKFQYTVCYVTIWQKK